MEFRVHELEQLANKNKDDIEALITLISILKKKVNDMSVQMDGIRLELDALSHIVEEKL